MMMSRYRRWSSVYAFLVVAAGMALSIPLADAKDADSKAGDVLPALTDETYEAYRTQIGPQPSDKLWQQIEWLPSYRQGLEAAAERQKPILLWVMNGHPLGCT